MNKNSWILHYLTVVTFFIISGSLLIFKVECSRISVFPIHVIIFFLYFFLMSMYMHVIFFWHVKRYDSLSYICINYLLIILSKHCCMTTICLKSGLIFWLSLINFLITICDRKFLIIIILLYIYIFHSDLFLSKRHSWCLKGHNHNDGVLFYFYCSQLYFFKAIIIINQNASVVEKL